MSHVLIWETYYKEKKGLHHIPQKKKIYIYIKDKLKNSIVVLSLKTYQASSRRAMMPPGFWITKIHVRKTRHVCHSSKQVPLIWPWKRIELGHWGNKQKRGTRPRTRKLDGQVWQNCTKATNVKPTNIANIVSTHTHTHTHMTSYWLD